MVNQDPAHHSRRQRKEVRAVAPVHGLLTHQSHEGFMHEGGSLNRVIRSFAAQMSLGQRAQFPVQERRQLPESSVVPAAPLNEQSGHRAIRLISHRHPPCVANPRVRDPAFL
jgi:hypothetical protein